ncbi:molybdate ABC transporter substrate-binding protein [Telmatospirillum siberiense]|uniref:Molybdate ABC transporter substrate-binding protein n=1 Tax=Telmatospirillum siberiense TaxID=382514 RepID=A0A2N3PTS4_9PROT|nr:molybdate ABC transporter substrate-binding protein [Telmatospirillum siberiense]PKU23787.1 molybdate ABC transporter substrate-binding protein [Telmatospirillum siberiense]
MPGFHGRTLLLIAMLGWMLPARPASAEVVVYAPGAMEEPLTRIAQAAGEAGVPFTLVIGHSPAQARQIVDGAPADIFISADPQWMDFLNGKKMLSETPIVRLASTSLVLVAPADSGFSFGGAPGESLAAQLGDGKLAIADPDMVPAGRFARAALEKTGQWAALQGKIAMLPHVRAVALMVERREVPAGIGFASDVARDGKLKIILQFPAEISPVLDFPLAVVAGHQRPEVAAVAAFVAGAAGRAVFKDYGFSEPSH